MPFMLRCNISYAAMQTNELWLVSGMPRWDQTQRSRGCFPKEVTTMSDAASAPFTPSSTVFDRLIAAIDRLLMSGARIAARNGDLPYFGL